MSEHETETDTAPPVEDRRWVLGYLAALAWADGEIGEIERQYLQHLIDTFAAEGDRDALRPLLDAAPEHEPDWDALREDTARGLYALRLATMMSMADLSVAAEEMTMLQQLATRAGLGEDTFYAVMREVQEHIATSLQAQT